MKPFQLFCRGTKILKAILKLHDLFQLKLLCFVYDCVNKISPSCFHSFFELVESVHPYLTRQATNNDIFLNQKNTLQYGLRSVRYFGAKCWNSIPSEIKSSPSCFHSFFELVESVHPYLTRQATNNDIFLNQKNTLQYGLRSVRYFGAKSWNNIPSEIKSSPSCFHSFFELVESVHPYLKRQATNNDIFLN